MEIQTRLDLGRALKILRAARGLTQSQLAKRVKVTASHLSLIESNQRDPSLQVMRHICTALAVPQSDLFRIAEDPPRALGIAP